MSDFKKFNAVIQSQIDKMLKDQEQIFVADVSKDDLWNTYIESFPAGTNEMYRERREMDCNSCKRFIRQFGNVVSIVDNKTVSIWEAEGIPYPYDVVSEKLTSLVKSAPIRHAFLSSEAQIGNPFNNEIDENGKVTKWYHLCYKVPVRFINKTTDSIESIVGSLRDARNVFARSMKELTLDAGNTILELIAQGSIYRGEEHKKAVTTFVTNKTAYDAVPDDEKENWLWVNAYKNPVAKIRNTAIGTMLIDLSEDVDLEEAVRKFEKVMAPSNYKRPTAIFTKKMVEDAEKTIHELGFENSLGRRHAVLEDITVNNVLFVNRDARKKLGGSVFDELKEEASVVNPKKFNKVEEVSIDDFMTKIVPTATNIELMMEAKHKSNLMSLVAPLDKEAPSMLKWDNNFSWSYVNDVADSMKQHVKNAGGAVDGVLRFSIQWNDNNDNHSDLDAHCTEPLGNHIFYGDKHHISTGGNLDVDIMDPRGVAVENITWPVKSKMQEGVYEFYVNNYHAKRNDSGFTAELEYEGQIYSFSYPKPVGGDKNISVAKIKFNKKTGIEFISSLDSTMTSTETWGVKTNVFTQVSVAMNSPNYWDGQEVGGNKHVFFFLEGCKHEDAPRGFYNEHLNESLTKHRKVFEALGGKMKVEPSEQQLSGLGFSSTNRNDIIAKVEGSVSRMVKVKF